jgi:predicted RNA-binding protein (virulence factor B family)
MRPSLVSRSDTLRRLNGRKSDAVRVYIRLDTEERLMARAAIGEQALEDEED